MRRRNWQDAPVVTIPVYQAVCPPDEGGCGSTEYIHIRGEENGDDSSTEQVVCCRCSLAYKIVRERRFPVREFEDC